jgi:uncharacterized protein YjbI with pentapeptide repeats
MTQDEIATILSAHKLWLAGEGGQRADLTRASLTGADLTGADLTGADLTRASLTVADLTRANLTGARLTGADLSGADLYGASLTGARLYGANLTGARLFGAKINNDKTAVGILRRAIRSDGYEFFLWQCEDGFYVNAGCRFFGMAEARAHWTATRAGTPLGDETQDILDMFEKAIARVSCAS